MIVFSGLTGYIGQEDDLYFWRDDTWESHQALPLKGS
jgi:hypothetical protein